nr:MULTISPECIES: dynamin family protein [Microbacterium]
MLEDAVRLVDAAGEVYRDDTVAADRIDQWRARLSDPLRLGIAGMVKAGKSTLLNAMIGERIAPTDAGECTRAVTWYRYGDSPGVVAHLQGGGHRRLALHRTEGRLVFELGGTEVEEIAHIDVRWPSVSLRSTVLIDTPGIESVTDHISHRTRTFLTPDDRSPSDADAIVYLMRHLHPSDFTFLEAFRDTAAGTAHAVNAVAVLSRADEVGAGRLDAMLSARKIAERYREHVQLRSLALTVLPVAGLLAESARTLREREFAALSALAGLDRARRERMLLSVDRFVGTDVTQTAVLDVAARQSLVDRFGISGIRLATALIRGGTHSAQQLSERLVQQSGLEELRAFVRQQFRARQAALKVRAVTAGLESLLAERPREGSAAIAAGVERLTAASHELRELDLLARSRTEGLGLDPDAAADAERILGGAGVDVSTRLGLGADARRTSTLHRIDVLVAQWRERAESPLASRTTARVCGDVVRTLEGIASEVAARSEALRSAADVDAAGGPAQGAAQQTPQQPDDGEPALQQQDQPERVG